MNVSGSKYLLMLAFCCSLEAQSISKLDQVDMQLALSRRQQILNTGLAVNEPAIHRQISRIVDNLSKTSFNQGYAFPTQLTYIEEPSVNAQSGGAGQIYVFSGLVRAVHANDGVMAFVIGHEMAHNRLQHQAKKLLRYQEFDIAYRQMYVRNPNAANLYKVAWQITEQKIERDEENQADQLGMRMAAEAGYHPDYAILASRVLRGAVGERSKFMTFFSDHPRWTTREEKTKRQYSDAMNIFNQSWPNAALSPGGVPPSIAIVSPIQINKQKSLTTASAQVEIRHLNDAPAILVARLFTEGDTNARTILTRRFTGEQEVNEAVSIEIPSTLLSAQGKKNSLMLEIGVGNEILYRSGLVGLRSSHKSSSNERALKASTSQSANLVLAEAAPGFRRDHQNTESETATLDSHSVENNAIQVTNAAISPAVNSTRASANVAPGDALSTKVSNVSVASDPAGAEVYVDGALVGSTPLTLTFPPSKLGFTLSVRKDGYSDWFIQTFATPGLQQFKAELHPAN